MLGDRPIVVTSTLVVAVAAHATVARFWSAADTWADLAAGDYDRAALYLGLAGVAAMAGGFAGVVIIFGLQGQSERFLKFRTTAGRTLRSNWTSVIGSSFCAAGLSLLAAVLDGLGAVELAPWLFELSALLVVHAVVRMLWLLQGLMRVVAAEDAARHREGSKVALGSLFRSAE